VGFLICVVVLWRITFAPLYPDCDCPACGRRRPSVPTTKETP
jgi:hypothetical protein